MADSTIPDSPRHNALDASPYLLIALRTLEQARRDIARIRKQFFDPRLRR